MTQKTEDEKIASVQHDLRGRGLCAEVCDDGKAVCLKVIDHVGYHGNQPLSDSERVGTERSAIENLLKAIKRLPMMYPDDLAQAITQAEDALKQEDKDLGGHESHGGRSDLEPAEPPKLSHDGTSSTD
jgi:hypothetical protein